jgi:hypothetical protein
MVFMRFIIGSLALLIGLAAGVGGAAAAPQVLGLTASTAPIPFACTGDNCRAVAGTFCLQRERVIPTWGAPYRASHPDRLTLALLGRDGRIARIAGGPWIKFNAYAGYTMVRLSVPRTLLAAHDATAVAVEVGPGIALVPLPQAGDGNPQSADELALATGPMRIAAAHYLDQPSVGTDAARLVAALVNALPEQHGIADDNSELWPHTITADVAGAVDPAALSGARRAYDLCRQQTDLRRCLVSRHREFMENGNDRFWDETAGY